MAHDPEDEARTDSVFQVRLEDRRAHYRDVGRKVAYSWRM
jgi:hypothetical protein